MTRLQRLLLAIAARSTRVVPRERAEWARAAYAEATVIAGTRDLAAWTIGLTYFAMGACVRSALPTARTAVVIVGTGAGLAWLDLNTDGTGTSLFALLIASAAVGARAPRSAAVGGLVVGCSVAVAHLALLAVGAGVPAGHPSTIAGASALLLLIVPAVTVSLLAARWRRLRG